MTVAQKVEIVTTCLGFCPQHLIEWEAAAKAFIPALWRSEVKEEGSRAPGLQQEFEVNVGYKTPCQQMDATGWVGRDRTGTEVKTQAGPTSGYTVHSDLSLNSFLPSSE